MLSRTPSMGVDGARSGGVVVYWLSAPEIAVARESAGVAVCSAGIERDN
jgi:hypothetical protein